MPEVMSVGIMMKIIITTIMIETTIMVTLTEIELVLPMPSVMHWQR